jgi:hypothetical protein
MSETNIRKRRYSAPPLFRGLIVVLAVLVPFAIPVGWIFFESHAAAGRTRVAADTGAQWAAERLGAVIGRFDGLTARLRPGSTAVENAALTARLLRLEPQLNPATSILVTNTQLRVVAASHPMAGELLGSDAAGWLRTIVDQPADRIQLQDFDSQPLLGMPSQVAMARRLDDAAGAPAGLALSFIDNAELRELVYPRWLRRSSAVQIVDRATGRSIAAYETAAPAGESPSPTGIVGVMKRAAEALWGEQRVLLEAPIGLGDLVWSVQLDPWDTLASDEPALVQRGIAVTALAVLIAMLNIINSTKFGRHRAPQINNSYGNRAETRSHDIRYDSTETISERENFVPNYVSSKDHIEDDISSYRPSVGTEGVAPDNSDPGSETRSYEFEDLLDASYVEPAYFQSLTSEYGQLRATEMLHDFVAAAGLSLPRLEALLASGDRKAFEQACQELSGLSRMFGASCFSESLRRLSEAEAAGNTEVELVLLGNEWKQTKRALLRLVMPEGRTEDGLAGHPSSGHQSA